MGPALGRVAFNTVIAGGIGYCVGHLAETSAKHCAIVFAATQLAMTAMHVLIVKSFSAPKHASAKDFEAAKKNQNSYSHMSDTVLAFVAIAVLRQFQLVSARAASFAAVFIGINYLANSSNS